MKTVSSREFNQSVSLIKKDSDNGPIFITDRGKPSYVLLSITDYNNLIGKKEDIVSLLGMKEVGNIDFEVPKKNSNFYHPEEFN